MSNPFRHVAFSDLQQIQHRDVREAALSLYTLLIRTCPSSREKSIALTKLEESIMWANKAIAHNGEV